MLAWVLRSLGIRGPVSPEQEFKRIFSFAPPEELTPAQVLVIGSILQSLLDRADLEQERIKRFSEKVGSARANPYSLKAEALEIEGRSATLARLLADHRLGAQLAAKFGYRGSRGSRKLVLE